MVAHATSNQWPRPGLRPINSMRDMVGVTTFIERAFADDMDASGHDAMREMRWMGTLFGWLDWFTSPGQGIMPGYVWVEDGQHRRQYHRARVEHVRARLDDRECGGRAGMARTRHRAADDGSRHRAGAPQQRRLDRAASPHR